MARRIPPWVVILAFAACVGGAMAAYAMWRARHPRSRVPAFCTEHLPSPALVQRLAGHALHAVPGRPVDNGCEMRLVPRANGPVEITVIRRRRDLISHRLQEIAGMTGLVPQQTELARKRAWYVMTMTEARGPYLIGVVEDGDGTLELDVDPKVFDADGLLAMLTEQAAR